MNGCPDDNALAAFMSGLLASDQRTAIEAHLDGCHVCAEVLAGAARGKSAARANGAEPEHPQQLGRYQLLGRLGQGGMGVVYEALDPTLGRTVALKLMRPDVDRSAGVRLVEEARSLARLSHPAVVAVLDAGEDAGHFYVAMERVHGQSLRAWLQPTRTAAQVLAVFQQLGSGLAAIHGAGLTLRDFKPDNVLIDGQGRATIIDLGLALEVAAGGPREIAGTYAYMAPEQLSGRQVGPAADQYAFALTLHEALFGRRPEQPDTPIEHSMPPGPQLPPGVSDLVPDWLASILLRALHPEPQQRWPDMTALLQQLDARANEERRGHNRLNALFSLLLWPFHVAINLLMLKVLATPKDMPPAPEVSQEVSFLAGVMATWLIGAFLTGWAPLGLVWTPLNAYGLLRNKRWAARSTVIYFLFAVPSVVGTPFAAYAFATLWRRAFPKRAK